MRRSRATSQSWMLVIGLMALPNMVIAQTEESINQERYQIGSTTETAVVELTVHETAPRQFWVFATGPGQKKATLNSHQRFSIIEEQTVKTLLEESLWLKVKVATEDPNTEQTVGWIYGGDISGEKTFKAVTSTPEEE